MTFGERDLPIGTELVSLTPDPNQHKNPFLRALKEFFRGVPNENAPYVGMNTDIIRNLKRYGEDVPIDFLARVCRRNPDEIKDDLESLKEAGVLIIKTKSE